MSEEAVGGWHAVLALLEQAPERVLGVWIDRARKGERREQLLKAAKIAGVKVQEATSESLDTRLGSDRHQGVVARCRRTQRGRPA